MRLILFICVGLIFSLGCARVRVEAPKEPIKVDISMRLDIYQHVQKDIDAIEGIVSGGKKQETESDKRGFLGNFVPYAYAQESLSPEVEQAALRRRDRSAELTSLQQKGIVGENKQGFAEVRNSAGSDPAIEKLVKAENEDRMIIYQTLAEKNNVALEEMEKIYAQRLQKDAPSGTPIEVLDAATGVYKWKIK